MSFIPYSYLGCYQRNSVKPLLDKGNVDGTKNQKSCFEQAKNNKFFALQTNLNKNCYIGNNNPQKSGDKVEDKYCSQQCTNDILMSDNMPDNFEKRPGCGSIQKGDNEYYSVYKVLNDLHPKSIKQDQNMVYLEPHNIGSDFKNGSYKFSDSSHAWHWSAKRAFDGNPETYWHTPYVWGDMYKDSRSKNYTSSPYGPSEPRGTPPNKRQLFRHVYKDNTYRPAVRHYRDPNKSILHSTQEEKLNIADINFEPMTHKGEWIQIEFPYQFILTDFTITGQQELEKPSSFTKMPRKFVILASNDGSNWTHIAEYDNHPQGTKLANLIRPSADGFFAKPGYDRERVKPFEFKCTTMDKFSMYRFVIKETYGSVSCSIGNINLKGRICINMDGTCNFRTTNIIGLNSSDMNSAGNFRSLMDNIDNDEYEYFQNNNNTLLEEGFMSEKVNQNNDNPIKENNVFNLKYSKY